MHARYSFPLPTAMLAIICYNLAVCCYNVKCQLSNSSINNAVVPLKYGICCQTNVVDVAEVYCHAKMTFFVLFLHLKNGYVKSFKLKEVQAVFCIL